MLWVNSSSIKHWLNQDQPMRPGRRRTYTDAAILCALLVHEAYHLPLRSTQGLVSSILRLLGTDLPTPHYSTLSRRACLLSVTLTDTAAAKQPIRHLVVDATGLKVYGEGDWKVRVHGKDKRRTWRKLHIAMDAATHQLTAALLTDKEVLDRHVLPELLAQIETAVERVCADGAYDFE